MGLDTSHDAWHGAYSAFTRFRTHLSEATGLPLIEGTYGKELDVDWSQINDDNLMGEWGEKIPVLRDGTHDPLLFLICHSDCDGLIHPYHAKLIADRLEELLPNLESIEEGGHIGNMADKTRNFIKGLRQAADANEDVWFG